MIEWIKSDRYYRVPKFPFFNLTIIEYIPYGKINPIYSIANGRESFKTLELAKKGAIDYVLNLIKSNDYNMFKYYPDNRGHNRNNYHVYDTTSYLQYQWLVANSDSKTAIRFDNNVGYDYILSVANRVQNRHINRFIKSI